MPKGRQPGQPKTGGRRKGTVNKIDAKHREEIMKRGITPLEYMIDILNDPELEARGSKVGSRPWARRATP